MKVDIPKGQYIKAITVNDDGLEVAFAQKKKVALLFISINLHYWPYLKQVIEDCRKNFLPQHQVDYFVWSDMPEKDSEDYNKLLSSQLTQEQLDRILKETQTRPNNQWWGRETIKDTIDFLSSQKNITITPTEPAPWPTPTLMRYHLFLQQEEALKDYDYVFYLDADMRVVAKISDEILGNGLTAAEHPMYSLRPQYVPPYEPNKDSTAYIKRPGRIIDENGQPRFKPYYWAGGFQGGVAKHFIEAMQTMKKNIDIDFDHNYTAIWNDESHWNKYLADYWEGDLITLSPSYIYPDSLIKEYYEPVWGKAYEPKIITLTKPFSLSKQAGDEINQFIGGAKQETFKCPKCGDNLQYPGHKILRLVECKGSRNPHKLEMQKL